MLVSELKDSLKKYKEEDLRLLVLEMYKAMPKKLREEKNIDTLLQNVHEYLAIGRVEKTQYRQTDIRKLKPEIDQFIDYAYKQYYFAPNNFVHKKERPKWRFKVKDYIKSLQGIPIEGEEGRAATDLLEKLYKMLSYASGYYLFSTEDPFRSIGMEQTALLDTVLSRKLGSGINKESVKSAVALVVDCNSSPAYILVQNLKTPDSKEIAIEQCKALKEDLDKSKLNSSRKSWVSDTSEYERTEKINKLVIIVFMLNIILCEYEKAIRFFNGNYIERDKEMSLYVLLDLLFDYKQKEYWLREYDEALKKGVKPREALRKTHQYIQENDKLPEYFLY